MRNLFPVTVSKQDSMLMSMPYQLLTLNSALLQPLLADYTQPRMRSEEAPEFVINEFSLVLLHLLIKLHTSALHHPGASIEVIMMTRKAMQAAAMAGSSATAAAPALHLDNTSRRGSSALRFPSCATSPLRLRWSSNWQDTVHAPVRCVYLPSLTWFSKHAGMVERERRMTALLAPLRAHLWPPTSWDQLLEQKDLVYSRFNQFMLPAVWIPLSAVNFDLQRLADALLRCSRRSGGSGSYVVKGSFSFSSYCVQRIEINQYQCQPLLDFLRYIVKEQHQHCVGIQPYVAGFEHRELRTWLVPDSVTNRWRSALTIRTTSDGTGGVTGELYQPLHGAALRVAQLVDDMLEQQKEFFERVRSLGVPALRIDCGFCDQRQQAFFNEFAPAGDAHMWSETHGQDLAYVIGCSMGKRVFDLMQKPAPVQ